MDKNHKNFNRQEISPGIVLEKYQEIINKKRYYVMKIDLELFNELDFCVDFTGSSKLKLEGTDSLISQVKIPPFSKVEVARLILEKGWTMKTKFRCFLELPPLEVQKEKLEPYSIELQRQINCTSLLKYINIAEIEETHIMDFLDEAGCSYLDHEFLPNDNVINNNPNYTINNYGCIADFRRFKSLQKAKRGTIKGSTIGNILKERISPNDIQQGKLADCWLLSALAALAFEPKLIKRLIMNNQNERGLLKVKLWDMSKWVKIALDDYFPCYPLSDTIFCQIENGKMWPLLFEKSFAKKYGSYTKLEEGNSKNAFIDLTNCPTFKYSISDPIVRKWIENDEFFARLSEWKRIGYAMTLTTKSAISDSELDVHCNHSYTVVAIYLDEGIIQLRDPLKVKKFSGKYRQDSNYWTDELVSKIKPVFNQNNVYITFDEFMLMFEDLTVCKLNRWNELTCKGKFVKSLEKENENIEYFSSRWFYKLIVEKAGKVIIGVHQADEKCPGIRETSPNVDLGIYIINNVNGSYNLLYKEDPRYERDIYMEIRLEPGEYYIIPKSSGFINLTKQSNISNYPHIKDVAFLSIIDETFEKIDILNMQNITKEELDTFYSYFDREITADEIDEILKPYYECFKFINRSKFDKKSFAILFNEMYEQFPENSKNEFFKLLGYNQEFISVRSRVFGLTFHSQQELEISTDDALKTGIDQTVLRLLLRNYGLNMKNDDKIDLLKKDVSLCYYKNRYIKKLYRYLYIGSL